MDKFIYLDNAATTRPYPEVIQAMIKFSEEKFYNPSSLYSLAMEVRREIEAARIKIAKTLNCSQEEILFTSGGTEANNWAIKGILQKYKSKGRHIITSTIEHHSVLNLCHYLAKKGWDVTFLPVDKYGLVNVNAVKEAIRDDTALVTIMFANNEIGTIEPIKDIASICREMGVIFHTDAVQAYGHLPIDVKDMNIDLLSASGHKFGGPKGVGFLYKNKDVDIATWAYGGAQEHSLRAGTENVAGIVGMGIAAERIAKNIEEQGKQASLRDYFIERVLGEIENTHLNGHPQKRLANNISISFNFIEGESLMLLLDNFGIGVSTGSACASTSLEPSHVLLAIGLNHETAHGTIRFTISEETTKEDLDYTIEKLKVCVDKLRAMSPIAK